MAAQLTREEPKNNGGGYIYRLTLEDGTTRRVCRGKHYSRYISLDGERIPVLFNEYVFDTFNTLPMVLDNGEWNTQHEYRQLPGDASALYEIVL